MNLDVTRQKKAHATWMCRPETCGGISYDPCGGAVSTTQTARVERLVRRLRLALNDTRDYFDEACRARDYYEAEAGRLSVLLETAEGGRNTLERLGWKIRAEAAEAKVAAVEALADTWTPTLGANRGDTFGYAAERIRAALAKGQTP